ISPPAGPPPSPPPAPTFAAAPLPPPTEPPQGPPAAEAKDYSGLGRKQGLYIPAEWGRPDFKGLDELDDERVAKERAEMLARKTRTG
ncbi:MAG TPA: hypothetical protein VGI39_03845, partial [Polyangiaceae bacterium]